jgi:hypothetical protein
MSRSVHDGTFELYDLRVEVVCPPGERIMCGAKEGDFFTLEGEMLHLPDGQGFSIYSLGMFIHSQSLHDLLNIVNRRPLQGALLPLLSAKQRDTHPNDWMSTDAEVACPDPNCKSRLRILRTGKRTFNHGDVTVVPLPISASPEKL